MQSDGEVVEPMATQLAGAEQSAIEQKKRIHPALAFGLGALSFAGWLGALILDATVFAHSALGSFLIHLPLMLLPAALVLTFGLRRLSDAERTGPRTAFAYSLVTLLTVPALIPNLEQHPVWLLLRLPVFGLALALTLIHPGLRLGLAPQGPSRASPALVAAMGFSVCAALAAIVGMSLPQPPPSCGGLACAALTGFVQTLFCAFALWISVASLVGAALMNNLGVRLRARWRTAS